MNEPTLALTSISKNFGHITALRGIDLEVRPGEILALLGDNGAGKSTLVKVASGLYSPDSGQIAVNGTINGVEHGFLLTPIPEPGSGMPFALALMLLPICKRKR